MAASSSKKIITLGSPGGWSRPKKICIESETGLSLLARLETRPSLTGLDPILFPSGLQPGEIVQLTGHPGSGKSLMILHLIVSVLLPKTWKGIYLNGCEAGVIFVACNSDLNIWQLENMLKKKTLFRKNRQGNKRHRFSEGGGEPEKSDKDYKFLGKEWAKSVTFKINLSILKCPVLNINQDTGSEFSHGESSECADITQGQSTSSKGVGLGKISNLRTLFCVALVSNQRRAKLSFTVHEEGIRWCN
ncbi:uncharacterized protein LOC135206758 [Macrobrachium nipponense]|uniref:uncharacterized protein LOC135206758 n=1 Tax=Macrobrachium nipponense TaxID=159736 RepID=UPI0030C7E89F